jgi:hypothetical protein
MPAGRFLLRFARPRVAPRSPDFALTVFVSPAWGLLVPPLAYTCNIQKKDRWNTWNMHLKHLQKQLKIIANIGKHPDKTLTTYVWNICNIQINTLATYLWKNRWNIGDIRLQRTYTTIATYATSWSTFVTSVWNNWNIPLKHLKHFKCTLATCIICWCGLLCRLH